MDTFTSDEIPGDTYLEDVEEGQAEDTSASYGLAGFVHSKYVQARDSRREHEERMLEAHLNFRGLPHERTQFTSTEESQVFIKVTKTKVLAAYGMIHEIMFPNHGNTFPIMVKPTPLPEGVDDSVHIDPKAPPPPQGSGERFELGPLAETLAPLQGQLRKGPGVTPGSLTFEPARQAAEFMDRKMQDQFLEGGAHEALKKAIFDSVLYGTGIVKGPFAVEKEYPYWDTTNPKEPVYKPKISKIPSWEHISIWDFFADDEAEGEDDMAWCVVRRRMNKSQLRGLKKRPSFRKNAIDKALSSGPSYEEDWWDHDIDDDSVRTSTNRYEVLEFWGTIDVEDFQEEIDEEFDLPDAYKDAEELNVSLWVCNGQVLKFTLNAYRPQKIPFHTFRYEYNPGNFYGIGLAENMSDTQLLMNGFMRMAIDNAARSGHAVFEVDEDALVPGQDLSEIHSGMVIRRQSGAMGQAMFMHKFNDVSQSNMLMYDKARQLADESTGFPSFAHGQTGINGVGRTASGISMFMGAASTQLKTVIKSYDNTLERLGASLFTYNMTFDFDPKALGDVTVSARGTDALINNEIRGQRIAMLIQQAANPIMAPFVKWPYVLREAAKAMDLDPDKFLNSPEEAMKQAMMLQQTQGLPGMGGGAPGGAAASDTQGAGGPPGMTGTGIPQPPGSPGFTGNSGGGGAPQ